MLAVEDDQVFQGGWGRCLWGVKKCMRMRRRNERGGRKGESRAEGGGAKEEEEILKKAS